MASDSAEKYEILEKIGHGSFGIIRKVRRKEDGMILCRKEISYLKMSQKEREQLHAEFTILSTLRHQNIVGYYSREHLKTTQDLHIYMEYCGNGDLGRVIRSLQEKNEYAEEAFVWSIFSQLVTALYRCHYGIDPPEVGKSVLGLGPTVKPKIPPGCMTILHRDLKPENIFLGEDNSVKLGDFGLSKVLTAQQFASTYVGTPFYMSPEICAAETYTLKSDVWSLGCIIYELCTRQPPFNAKSHYQLVQKIKEGKVAPLPNIYSSELSAVIADCLRVNPDRRPDTAALLNLPVVRLMRKEREVVEMGRALQKREAAIHKKEEALSRRVRELEKRAQKWEADKVAIRQEIDASVRREWETKARLEIDRVSKAEIQQLQSTYEEEVQARVQIELNQHLKRLAAQQEEMNLAFQQREMNLRAREQEMSLRVQQQQQQHQQQIQQQQQQQQQQQHQQQQDTSLGSSSTKTDFPYSSIGHESNQSALTAATDATDFSVGPSTPNDESKKGLRTPFVRAQTMYAGPLGTPMDVDKMSPSPCAPIAALSLSPRRKNGGKGNFIHTANIFARDPWRKAPEISDEYDALSDEYDSEEAPVSPSPSREVKRAIASSRPSLPHTQTAPAHTVLKNRPSLPAPNQMMNRLGQATSSQETRPLAERQFRKIASLTGGSSDLSSRGGLISKATVTNQYGNNGGLVSKMGNIKGRSLLELNQARSGIRPSNHHKENSKPAVWNPETDDMPSPFIVKAKHRPLSGI